LKGCTVGRGEVSAPLARGGGGRFACGGGAIFCAGLRQLRCCSIRWVFGEGRAADTALLSRVGEHFPVEWIGEAAKRTEAKSIPHRHLADEQVVWLMVALALYRHQSISEVPDSLGLAVPDAQAPFVSKSAAAQARQRLGSDPLKWISEHSAQHCCGQDRRAYVFKELVLFAMDGITLTTRRPVNTSGRELIPAEPWPAIPKCVV
jgi:hypothetical protein